MVKQLVYDNNATTLVLLAMVGKIDLQDATRLMLPL